VIAETLQLMIILTGASINLDGGPGSAAGTGGSGGGGPGSPGAAGVLTIGGLPEPSSPLLLATALPVAAAYG
jgi:hypothetical protein